MEHSVYVACEALGRGLGGILLEALQDRHGFRRVGTRERIALMGYGPYAGQWRDTILLERRLLVP